MSYTKKTDLVIYETTDYEQFGFVHENRDITINRALDTAIVENDKLRYNPIIVNADYEVIDGQHRLTIARRHGKPIFFVVDEDSQRSDIRSLNSGTKIWTMYDHLAYHAKLGNAEYIYVSEKVRRHQMSLTTFIHAFCRNVNDKSKMSFKNGDMCLAYSQEEIDRFLNCYDDIYDQFIFLSNIKILTRAFQSVAVRMIVTEGYDHKRMMSAIKRYPDKLLTAHTFINMDNIKAVLVDGLYNHCLQKNSRLTV